jgi:hypothetical protein
MALNIANDVIICRWSFSVLTAFELLSILFVLNGLASVALHNFSNCHHFLATYHCRVSTLTDVSMFVIEWLHFRLTSPNVMHWLPRTTKMLSINLALPISLVFASRHGSLIAHSLLMSSICYCMAFGIGCCGYRFGWFNEE